MAVGAEGATRRGASALARARIGLAVVSLGLVLATLSFDLPRASKGEFWGDGATYYSMAWSLARDFDLRFEAKDLERIRSEYPTGPQGLFLKRTTGAWTFDRSSGFPWVRRVRPGEGRLYYAKAFAYPLAAAPFVALFGTRGLLLTNALALSLGLLAVFETLRRRGFRPYLAWSAAVSVLLFTVTPVYVIWPTPEIFGFALVAAGYWAWAAGAPLLGAVLLGVAGYLKPPNLLMAAPLLLEPFVSGAWRTGEMRLWGALREVSRRAAIAVAATVALYGVNAIVTGEANYQGGERKTFYDQFPFDGNGATFDSAGAWMTTNQVGPLVAGRDDAQVNAQSGPARRRAELLQTLRLNLVYFWVGRFGGALAYFLPAVVALLVFLCRGPRSDPGWLALLAVALSWAAYIWIIPDNWYGGGGTVGNRYFLNLLPAFVFLVPAARARWVIAAGPVGALLFLGPVLVSPLRHSLHPGDHVMKPSFRLLPAELTMLNDLSVFTEPWRKKRPYGFVGNSTRPADRDAYFLYFMDDGSYGKEEWAGRQGFWLRGGRAAEIVVRAFDLALVDRMRVRLIGGPLGDTVDVRLGWKGERVRLAPGQAREVELPAGDGIPYYDTYVHVLRFTSHRRAPLADGRPVGAFVEVRLLMRAPPAAAP